MTPLAASPSVEAPPRGLSEAQAARALAARGRPSRPPSSRSYASIVRANVFTVFNLMLAGFGALTLVFGDWRDALFLGVLIANTTIGIVQEVRAKRALDRLALLVAPAATVVRDGTPRQVPPEELVEGDLVLLQPGDQVLADGRLVAAGDLHVDESILTGESEPVAHRSGDDLRSGAFVAEGTGSLVVTVVGEGSYAQQLLGEARSFRHPRSPLEIAVNRLLLALLVLVVGLGGLLGYSLWHRDAPAHEAVATATAGVVSLIPEGLVLLVSLTYAVASVRMARRGVLAQQLNAIESLASADVICLDKTGTLTEAAARVVAAVPAAGCAAGELEGELAAYGAASTTRNATLEAIAVAYPGTAEPVIGEVPFASRRRWSAVQLPGRTLVLGAPELFALDGLEPRAAHERAAGRRVVALASADGPLDSDLPSAARVLGIVVVAERLRPEAAATVAFLRREGVELKVLSGDAPETVGAIAADVGLDVRGVVSGLDLPDDPDALAALAAEATVIGRISPAGKRDVVQALRRSGRYVAMVGDGVNDVPALKASRLAIAQGTGTAMAKSVADLVLVNGEFGAVPALIAEGRQALRNLQRVARLYVTKSAFAAFLILLIGTTSTAYPLLPRHFSLAATLTIGIPTFFLALAPSTGAWRPEGFAKRVARFAVPAGTITGVGVLSSYLFALHDLDARVEEARTIATCVVVAVGLYLVLAQEAGGRRRTRAVTGMCAALGGLFVLALTVPAARAFFELEPPTLEIAATATAGAGLSIAMLALAGFAPSVSSSHGADHEASHGWADTPNSRSFSE
jgi:P-type E1-E2 ATPase